MSTSQREVLTAREAADLLRVTVRTVQRMALEGRLPYFRVGNRLRFYRADLLALTAKDAEPRDLQASGD
jgi:excisionase family DNA binding protein